MAFDPVLTLTQLLSGSQSPDAVLSSILTDLGAGTTPFPVTDWNTGGVVLTLLEQFAAQLADMNTGVMEIAQGGFVSIAPGNDGGDPVAGRTTTTWLDMVAKAQFDEERIPAAFGQFRIRLTVAPGFGPYTIGANGLWVLDPMGAYRYQSIDVIPVSISNTTPTDFTVQAELAGAAYNTIAAIGITVSLVTSLLGVTAVTILAPGAVSTAAVRVGADLEDDDALRLRCTTKWSRLSIVSVNDAMVNAAMDVVSVYGIVSHVLVDDTNPHGAGTVDIYIASSTGATPSGLVSDVNGVLQLIKPLTSILHTVAATADTRNITATCYVPAVLVTGYPTIVVAQLQGLAASLDIGDGATKGIVYYSRIMQILIDAGARNVELLTLAGDVVDIVPAKGHVSLFTNSVTVIGV